MNRWHAFRYAKCNCQLGKLAKGRVTHKQAIDKAHDPFPSMGHHDIEFDREETVKFLMWLLQFGCGIDEEWTFHDSSIIPSVELRGLMRG